MKVRENTVSNLSELDESKKIWVKPTVNVISQGLIQSGNIINKMEATTPSGVPGVS